ncbi:DUF418 domain-containing protein [Kangiella sp. TOML190]|uniref:DUF418 domain-containing protein n=1 Tax=Kangiella sp. TOML190 TaxID=2931351 RepID=UPI00203FEFB6|nr:DUF418 domain-containing protein [Kangiella sp. TOML190]
MDIAASQASERHQSLDLLRGFAVLGILVMNIATIANINAFYMNPYVLGEPSSINLNAWFVNHFFADQKFYTLFSMLFGAGIMLMAQRANNKGVAAGPIHYRRMGWLLFFGLIHGYLIWYGDILATYALMGFWVYLLALNTSAKKKFIIAAVLMGLYFLMMYGISNLFYQMSEADLLEMTEMFYPSSDTIAAEVAAYRGSWAEQFDHRLDFYSEMLLNALFIGPLRIGSAMLLGMALYQTGVLTAQRSKGFYWKFLAVCLTLGVLIQYYDYRVLQQGDFNIIALFKSFGALNSMAAVFIALAYVAIFCLWFKSGLGLWIRHKFEAVGRMAFTNYITQSVICTTIFYGFGFGYFAELERYQLYFIVLAIFMLQLVWSELWLKKYYFGPLEWLWRSLTYGKLQRFSRAHS